jgi:hypothetical protein
LFIHFEHEKWKPILVEPSTRTVHKKRTIPSEFPGEPPTIQKYTVKKKIYQIKRMVPPGKIRYVFSSPRMLFLAKDRMFNTEKTL